MEEQRDLKNEIAKSYKTTSWPTIKYNLTSVLRQKGKHESAVGIRHSLIGTCLLTKLKKIILI